MCEPVMLGTAASASLSSASVASLGIGSAAIGSATALATKGAIIAPASAGLFGSGGLFSWGATLNTLGTLGSVTSALYTSGVQQANMTYQGQMAEYQAKIDENNAIMAERAAEYDADIIDERRARFIAAKTASIGKSGTVISDGSNLATTIDSYEEFTSERLARLHQGDVQAAAHRSGARGQTFAAQNARDNASRAELAGYINTTTAIGQGAYRSGLLS